MPKEIERKFLVRDVKFLKYLKESANGVKIRQGYLSSVAERTVRVRIKGEKAFLTIKGVADASGIERYEWEREISLKDAGDLLQLCEPGIIEKMRYEVPYKGFLFEVDLFEGEHEGLVIAELELDDPFASFSRPSWLGEEVTGDPRYYNSQLRRE
jgi:adenylate cyclase